MRRRTVIGGALASIAAAIAARRRARAGSVQSSGPFAGHSSERDAGQTSGRGRPIWLGHM